jgi:hypothetical protein
MGLTIQYTLSTRRRLDLEQVKALLTPLRAKARALEFEEVGNWVRLGPDCEFIRHRPPGVKRFADRLPPLEGWLFHATPGDGCESVEIGLCRFAGVTGWRLESFCKTQYASRHGWEHFLKCHRGVVELLWEAERLGIKVRARDEGELWETGSHARLRRALEEYEGPMAAFAGALKDAGMLGAAAACPILEHPQFEQLEAAGVATHGDAARRAVQVVKVVKAFAAGGDREGA